MYSANRAYTGHVHVRGRPVKEVHFRGRTYIEGRKGTEYTLHFGNPYMMSYDLKRSPLHGTRVLVIPSVDGLCVIDGKPAGRNSPGFIVEHGQKIDIPGWMVNSSTAAKFTFWPQDARGEQTYVEELSKSGANVDLGNQGLIGFLVLEEEIPDTISPPISTWEVDHSLTPRGIGSSSDLGMMASANLAQTSLNCSGQATMDSFSAEDTGMGTKFGEATDFRTRTGEFKRGKVVGEIVIEYDTLRGLKDRGIPVHLFKGSNKMYGERSAFPADQELGCTPPPDWEEKPGIPSYEEILAFAKLARARDPANATTRSYFRKAFKSDYDITDPWDNHGVPWGQFKRELGL